MDILYCILDTQEKARNNGIGDIRLSEVHRKTGVKLVSNGIVGRNLGTKQKVTSQIRPHNTIVDRFGTSLSLNFGKANFVLTYWQCLWNKHEILPTPLFSCFFSGISRIQDIYFRNFFVFSVFSQLTFYNHVPVFETCLKIIPPCIPSRLSGVIWSAPRDNFVEPFFI